MAEPAPPAVAALAGLRVLDLADESAVFATRILADLGADVILVEPPGGSRARHLAPFLDGQVGVERSLVHLYHNANKRSITLDIASGEGAELLRRLAAGADVLVETARPGKMADLGLGYDELGERNPQLIYVSVTPFGQNGEWKERAANDLVAAAAGGLLWVTGEPKDPPVQGAANPSFAMASLVATTGVMIALTGRDRAIDAWGAHLDISLQEATVMSVLQTSNPNHFAWHERVPGRPGMSGALECADGEWVAFNPRPDRFSGFLEWLEEAGIETDLTPDDWAKARIGAPLEGNPMRELILELGRRHEREEFLRHAFRTDQLCLPTTDFPYMANHEHFAVNRQFLAVEHELLGRELGFVRSPVDAMAREIPLRRAPALGEHNVEVYAELGLSGDEVDRLVERGLVS
ncbi:MAG: CaiB/BaiF CoA-transferase family protein [Myxococcota bacterium]